MIIITIIIIREYSSIFMIIITIHHHHYHHHTHYEGQIVVSDAIDEEHRSSVHFEVLLVAEELQQILEVFGPLHLVAILIDI